MSVDLDAVWARYEKALEARPAKGPWTGENASALADSCADVPGLVKEIKGLKVQLEGTWDDAVLFGRARDDIAALVAEVERLRAQVNELACLWDAVTDAVGVDTDSTRGEWQTAFDAKIESYHGHGYESGKRDEREENKRLSAQIDAERMAVDGIGQDAIAAAEPHLRKKWAEEIREGVNPPDTGKDHEWRRGFITGVLRTARFLEGAGE